VTDDRDLLRALQRPLAETSREALGRFDSLAHYTRAAVASSILTEDELWLSHVQALSDVSEVSAGARLIRRRLFRMAEAGAGGPLIAVLARTFDQVFEEVFAAAFVFCLSGHDREADRDGRLAMWRAYGEEGDGACLVFDRDRLVEAGSCAMPTLWTAMVYETEEAFEARLDAFFDTLDGVLGAGLTDRPTAELARVVGRCLMAYAMSHKHPAFRDEQEIRLFHVREPGEPAPEGAAYGFCHETRGIRPIFRIDVRSAAGGHGVGDMLEEVILGPSNNAPVHRLAMEAVLDAKGLGDRPIRLSEIPFRARR
jgi:hypothetical protein